MRRWAGQQAVGRGRPLLPAAVRPLAAALLAVCVTVAALLGAWLMHERRAGWLDAAIDARLRDSLGGHPAVLNFVVQLGDPIPVTAMTTALVIACLAARRWRGAVLAAVSVTAAAVLTELVLKPLFDRTLQGNLVFPSGHATGTFALATVCVVLLAGPPRLAGRPRLPGAVRLCLALTAVLAACTVAATVIALGYHYFTDTVGGAAVGTAVVLATAFVVDRLSPRSDEPGADRRLTADPVPAAVADLGTTEARTHPGARSIREQRGRTSPRGTRPHSGDRTSPSR